MQVGSNRLRSAGLACWLACCTPAAAINFKEMPQMQPVDGGNLSVPYITILPDPVIIQTLPNSGVNHIDLNCGGAGGSVASTFSMNITGPTMLMLPIIPGNWMNSGSSVVTCSGNFGILPNNDLNKFTFTTTVQTTGVTRLGTAAQTVKDPVSSTTGEFVNAMPALLTLGGPLGFDFEVYYATFLKSTGITAHMGANWMNNFDWTLNVNGSQAVVNFYGGKQIAFTKSGTAWNLTAPEVFAYQLAATGTNTFQFLDLRSNLTYTFSGAPNATTLGLTAVQDRNGNTLTVTQSANGTSQVSDGLGRTLTFTYDSNGNLIKVADQTGRSVAFAYANGNLTRLTDANGGVRQFAYTSAGALTGLMTSTTLPGGNTPLTQTYDSIGRVATQADSRGNVTAYTYDLPNGGTSYKEPTGSVWSSMSSSHAYLLSVTDPDNQATTMTYDANGRRNSITDRLGGKSTIAYSPSGNMSAFTDALGNMTSYT